MKPKPGFHGCFAPPKPPKNSICAIEFWCTRGKDKTECKEYKKKDDAKC